MARRLNVNWPTLLGQHGHGQDKLACSRCTGFEEAVIPPVCIFLCLITFTAQMLHEFITNI